MILRVSPLRFRMKSGKRMTKWIVEKFTLLGWDWIYHHGLVGFRKKEDADEFVRLYNAIKK